MAIKNLTTDVRASFPQVGTLRKGAARDPQQPNRPGKDLQGFRFTSDRPEVVEAFEEAYGTEPRVLHVFLPQPGIDDNWQAWCEEWVAGGLVHRCDGETMVLWQERDGTYSLEPKDCPYYAGEKERDKVKRAGCKPVGRLNLILPELVRAGYVGYVLLSTTSKHDIRSITASLLDASRKREGNRLGLQGIEWTLRRQTERISMIDDSGKRVRRVKNLVKLEPSAQWIQAQLATAQADALGQLPAMTGVSVVDSATGEIIAPPPEENGDEEDVVDSTATEVGPEPAEEPESRPDRPDWERLKTAIMKRELPMEFRDIFVRVARKSSWNREQTMKALLDWEGRYRREPDQALADLLDEVQLGAGYEEAEEIPF